MVGKIKIRQSSDGLNDIKDNTLLYESVTDVIEDTFELPQETLHMLFFDEDYRCIGKENIQMGAGTSDAVAIDMDKCENIWKSMKASGLTKWGLTHNHPFVADADGKWVQTLVSDGDYTVTKCAAQAAFLTDSDLEFVGHFIANMEDDEKKKKIISMTPEMDKGIKYDREILNKIKEGEL